MTAYGNLSGGTFTQPVEERDWHGDVHVRHAAVVEWAEVGRYDTAQEATQAIRDARVTCGRIVEIENAR